MKGLGSPTKAFLEEIYYTLGRGFFSFFPTNWPIESRVTVSSKRVLVNLVVKVLDRRSRVKINSGASVSWDPLSSPNIYTATTMPRAAETASFKASRIS
jgi:hypothetical protein